MKNEPGWFIFDRKMKKLFLHSMMMMMMIIEGFKLPPNALLGVTLTCAKIPAAYIRWWCACVHGARESFLKILDVEARRQDPSRRDPSDLRLWAVVVVVHPSKPIQNPSSHQQQLISWISMPRPREGEKSPHCYNRNSLFTFKVAIQYFYYLAFGSVDLRPIYVDHGTPE